MSLKLNCRLKVLFSIVLKYKVTFNSMRVYFQFCSKYIMIPEIWE